MEAIERFFIDVLITCGTFMDVEEFKKALEGTLEFFPRIKI